MSTSNMQLLPEGPLGVEVLSEKSDKQYDSQESRPEELEPGDSEAGMPKKRARPRIHPYGYEKLEGLEGAAYDSLKHVCTYNNSSYLFNPDGYAALKEGYGLAAGHIDPSLKLHEFKSDELKETLNDLADADYKDKNDTDTRLTSSSEVLSNFNYETIDNYEPSYNETIDNYTTSEEYVSSLNDNCDFPLKSNDACFSVDEASFNTSTTFNASDDFIQCSREQMLQKEPELAPSKEQQMLDEQLAGVKEPASAKATESELESTRDLEMESETSRYMESELEPSKELEVEIAAAKELERDKKHMDAENMYVISEELRQSYIRQSKLLPKIRGVWFNSTVRRMGWVGQAYKKCKRIEKIFSINKHGFEGARNLAIAFRNSQKPTNKSDVPSYPDVSLKDVIKPISQLRINLPTLGSFNSSLSSTFNSSLNSSVDSAKGAVLIGSPAPGALASEVSKYLGADHTREHKGYSRELTDPQRERAKERRQAEEAPAKAPQPDENDIDDHVYPVDYRGIMDSYKSELSREEASARDGTCRDALLFMLYELAALLELDFPVPPISSLECKRGVSFHINFLENSKRPLDLLPYINSLARYICRGVTPTDMAHFELYSLIRTLSHCRPLTMELPHPNA